MCEELTCMECLKQKKACTHYPTYGRNWVLHRFLGHHPTNPNLKSAGVTKDTPALDEAIDHMLTHRTYTSRVKSYVEKDAAAPSESNMIADMALEIISGIAKCPFCGGGY